MNWLLLLLLLLASKRFQIVGVFTDAREPNQVDGERSQKSWLKWWFLSTNCRWWWWWLISVYCWLNWGLESARRHLFPSQKSGIVSGVGMGISWSQEWCRVNQWCVMSGGNQWCRVDKGRVGGNQWSGGHNWSGGITSGPSWTRVVNMSR